MENIPRSDCGVKPTAVIPFFDRVVVWLKSPASRATIEELRENCGGHLHVANRSARFDRTFHQWLDLKQPKPAALRWISNREDALINFVEVALDFSFGSWSERDYAYDFLDRHLVRRWHGSQAIRYHPGGLGGTRYDGDRNARNAIVLYRQKRSRITGAPHVLHLEWRCRGARAVRGIGVSSGGDLLAFDHRRFWQHRLLLLDIEPARIGRFVRNWQDGTRSRQSHPRDLRTGQVYSIRSCATMQELIDRYSWLRRIMTRISAQPFLPAARPSLVIYPAETTTHPFPLPKLNSNPLTQNSLSYVGTAKPETKEPTP